MIPTDPEVRTVNLASRAIHRRLEASLESVFAPDPFDQLGGYVLRVSGLSAVVRFNNPYRTRAQHREIGGAPFEPDRLYRVAAAGDQALGGAGIAEGTGVQAIDALRRYFGRHSPVHAELSHQKFIAI